ncbi:MAG TPA: cyclic nucleotide-binding protein [Treponema sp.]|nr:cyclic nucleotide-binding protein [Treponema sp.]
MGVLGVINTDPEIKKLIDGALRNIHKHGYEPRYLSRKEDILEFLNYDLPEIVLINFSDPDIDIAEIVSLIQHDKWILNFGIIGIFSGEQDTEENYLRKYQAINILTMMDVQQLSTHLVKSIQIIEKNYQIIFQREFTRDLLSGSSGSFTIDNDILSIHLYAGIGATILAQRGLINPEHKMQLQLALSELIVNAVEHGNCGITYEEKTAAMENGLSVPELVAQRCKDPAIKKRKVEFLWDIHSDHTAFVIRDEGDGFDVVAHLKKIASQDKLSLHGRGIRIASAFSTRLKYNKKGNEVTVIIEHDDTIEHNVPPGFSRQQIHEVKAGDIILRENEPSDYLYYIISGNYSVYHKSKKVGSLSVGDIFMGEIAFLLNQRRSASVRADGQGKLVPISRKALVSIIRDYPHYGIFFSRLLARRLVRANDQNAALTEKLRQCQNSQTPEN